MVEPFINSTMYDDKLVIGDLEASYTFTDDNLYAIYAYIDNNQIFNDTTITNTTYYYDLVYDTENLSYGNHTVQIKGVDGHTAKEIPNWLYKKQGKDLEFEFDTGEVYIYPKSSSYDPVVTKKKDRYSFNYKKQKKKDKEVYWVYTPGHYIDIPERTDYSGHLVIPSLNKWVDFETVERKTISKIKRLADDQIEVTVEGLAGLDEVTFNSIGELNVRWVNHTFWKVNVTTEVLTTFDYVETETVDFNANVQLFGADYTTVLSLNNVTPILNIDGTDYIPSTYNDSGDIGFFYRYSFPLQDDLLVNHNSTWNITINTNESIFPMEYFNSTQIYLGECNLTDAQFNTTSINLNIYNEVTRTATVANLDAKVTVKKSEDGNATRTQIVSFSGDSTYRLCIAPSTQEYFLTNTTFTYYTNEHDRRLQTIGNTLVSSTPINFDFYLLNSSQYADIILGVVDENDRPLSDYYIDILRYYSDNESYTQVEQAVTDYKGEVGVRLTPNSVFYKFLIKDEAGGLLKTINSFKIFQNEYVFKVVLADRFADDTLDLNQVDGQITYDNASGTYTLVYTSPTGFVNEMCLKVDRVSQFAEVNECSNCLGTDSGSINCVVNGTNGNTYTAYAYLNSNTEFSSGIVKTIKLVTVKVGDYLTTFQQKGNGVGLGISFIFMLTIPFMAGFGLAGLIIGTLLSLAVTVLTGMTYLSVSALATMVTIGVFIMWRSKE